MDLADVQVSFKDVAGVMQQTLARLLLADFDCQVELQPALIHHVPAHRGRPVPA
jgi:hypothetical protein